LGVSTSDDPLSTALLLICQVPFAGGGIAGPAGPTAIVAVAVAVAPRLSVTVSVAV
jgi:hypothetical protein